MEDKCTDDANRMTHCLCIINLVVMSIVPTKVKPVHANCNLLSSHKFHSKYCSIFDDMLRRDVWIWYVLMTSDVSRVLQTVSSSLCWLWVISTTDYRFIDGLWCSHHIVENRRRACHMLSTEHPLYRMCHVRIEINTRCMWVNTKQCVSSSAPCHHNNPVERLLWPTP